MNEMNETMSVTMDVKFAASFYMGKECMPCIYMLPEVPEVNYNKCEVESNQ